MLFRSQHPEVKLVIAPHVIDENHLVEIIRKLKRPYVRYTRADEKNVRKADCLIIDCFGLLSSITFTALSLLSLFTFLKVYHTHYLIRCTGVAGHIIACIHA